MQDSVLDRGVGLSRMSCELDDAERGIHACVKLLDHVVPAVTSKCTLMRPRMCMVSASTDWGATRIIHHAHAVATG
jgi:hypothetical protein